MESSTLVLQDGSVHHGLAFGAATDRVFEIVFNTSLTGYQEIITDPSYQGQGIVFTNPHIGNTGINPQDNESECPHTSAVIIAALSPVASNWRASSTLSDWLAQHSIPGISGVDTRAITRSLREQGTMKAAISNTGTTADDLLQQVQRWDGLDGKDLTAEVSCKAPYSWQPDDAQKTWMKHSDQLAGCRIVVLDFGVKRNILRCLSCSGADVWVVPADTPAQEIQALNPQGVLLSNGPGDPAGVPQAAQTVKALLQTQTPIMGICLGHQILGLALGGKTSRLKFGHHGGNHPVKDFASSQAWITAQNHNFQVLQQSLDPRQVEITHVSLNDGTLEGMRLRHQPVFSVQFHPESSPGPEDAQSALFQQFFHLIHTRKEANHA